MERPEFPQDPGIPGDPEDLGVPAGLAGSGCHSKKSNFIQFLEQNFFFTEGPCLMQFLACGKSHAIFS